MIHVVVGPPCSGKSTFVAEVAGPRTPRFDFDRLASTVAGVELNHEKPPAVAEVVMAMRRGLVGWLTDFETTPPGDVWLINAFPPPSLIAKFAAVGAQFHLIDPGIEECLARAEVDGRPAGTVERIRAWYANPPVLPGHDDDDDEKAGETVNKDFKVDVKAADVSDAGEGIITAYAAVFGNIDSYGDVIIPGAFSESLTKWKESGNNLPLLYGHDFADPFSNIGTVTDAKEDDHGLLITASLDLDNAKAAQVYRLLKERRLSQMSFAFRTITGSEAERDGRSVYELRELQLFEVSVVPIGANEETEILTVKSAVEALATAVKQAAALDSTDRVSLARACESAAGELKSAAVSDPPAHAKSDDDISKARARAARAFLMI